MGKARFTSYRPEFMRKHNAVKDMIMGHMAADIETAIKTTAGTPVKRGDLKAETRHFRSPSGGFRVESDKEYAAVQELGRRMTGPGAPTRAFTHYSTGGTSAGWFRRAVDAVWRNRKGYIVEARRAVGL